MATPPRNIPPVRPVTSPAVSPAGPAYTAPVKKTIPSVTPPRGNQVFLFDRSNYAWMLGGVACILLGLILMAGGKSPDPHQFNYEEIYSTRRITIAPILILIGFGLQVYAIMKRPANHPDNNPVQP